MHASTLVLALSTLFAGVKGHAALMQLEAFHKGGLDASMAFPLNSGSGDTASWFWRGLKPADGTGSISLKAGGSVDLKIGCDPSAPANNQFCDDGGGSLHSSDGKRTGCGLAISYKDFSDIKPEDLIVFSTLDDCVHPAATHTFKIPSNLPATSKGKPATCAWGWIPSADSSADEMYMTGFKCEVTGSSAAVGSTISNAKELPFQYFAVSGFGSNGGQRPSWSGSFKTEGAQKLVVSGSSSKSSGSSKSGSDSSSSKSTTVKAKTSGNTTTSGTSSSSKGKKCKAKSKARRAFLEPANEAPIVARAEVMQRLKRHPHLRARAIR